MDIYTDSVQSDSVQIGHIPVSHILLYRACNILTAGAPAAISISAAIPSFPTVLRHLSLLIAFISSFRIDGSNVSSVSQFCGCSSLLPASSSWQYCYHLSITSSLVVSLCPLLSFMGISRGWKMLDSDFIFLKRSFCLLFCVCFSISPHSRVYMCSCLPLLMY